MKLHRLSPHLFASSAWANGRRTLFWIRPDWRPRLGGLLAGLGIFLVLAGLSVSAQNTNKTKADLRPNNSAPSTSSPSAASAAGAKGESLAARVLMVKESSMTMAMLDDRQKLGAGDRVSYRVIEDQDDPKSLFVTDAGDIDIPYLGLVPGENKTCKQLAEDVKVLLEKNHYYRATVIIGVELINKKRILGKVYVVGQVRQTGPQDILGDENLTVSKAIMKAGGFSDFADKKKVKLIRIVPGAKTQKTYEINVSDVWDKGKTENDMAVQPDDTIVVPARMINL